MQRIVLFIGILLLTACSATTITTSCPNASIYVNGKLEGKGTAEIPRVGTPKRTSIVAKVDGIEVGDTQTKRRFTILTFIGGVYTYGLGFFLFWEYPSAVFVPCNVNPSTTPSPVSPWDSPPAGSQWD